MILKLGKFRAIRYRKKNIISRWRVIFALITVTRRDDTQIPIVFAVSGRISGE